MDTKAIHAKPTQVKASYGLKYLDQGYNGWQLQALALTDISSAPVTTTADLLV